MPGCPGRSVTAIFGDEVRSVIKGRLNWGGDTVRATHRRDASLVRLRIPPCAAFKLRLPPRLRFRRAE